METADRLRETISRDRWGVGVVCALDSKRNLLFPSEEEEFLYLTVIVNIEANRYG